MPVELKPGDRFLDRFQIQYLSAEGGMASIYVARDEITTHDIAVKSLYPYYADNKTIVSRFLEEGRIQMMLRHPNIVRVFQVIEEPSLAILMEYVEGPTLDEYLAEHGPMNKQEIIDVIIPSMSAVGFAHSRGIIHRDIKPSNILLQDGNVRSPKILDFGVAKVKGQGGQDLTATGTTVGTLHYMSPEQIVGHKDIDGRADIYSLGVTMYKLVAGEVPFNAPTEFALMMAQVEAQPLPPSQLNPSIDADLEAVILKAMEKKPAKRYQTIKEFTSALLDIRMSADLKVEQTVSTSISSELLNFALMADEVAHDSDSVFSQPLPGEANVTLGVSTMEIEATIQSTRPEKTQELGSSAIMRLTEHEVDALDAFASAEEETEDMESLKARMPQGGGMSNTDPDRHALLDVTRPSRPSAALLAGDDITRRDGDEPITKPSRDAAPLPKPPVSAGYIPPPLLDPEEDLETISIQKRVKLEALRSGVLNAGADSKDMTAPKLDQRKFDEMLKGDLASAESGPKMVVGYNPADTSERTVERPQRKIPSRSTAVEDQVETTQRPSPIEAKSQPARVTGVSPSSDPYSEGRMHLKVSDRETESADKIPQVPHRPPVKRAKPPYLVIGLALFVFILLLTVIVLLAFVWM